MSIRVPLIQGLRALFRRRQADRDMRDEIDHYLAEAAAAHRARGLADAEAWRAAKADMGSAAAVAQQVRESRWETTVESLLVDLRRAARRLRRSPGFAAVTVITLALGIGASTAIFSTVRPVLLDALPYPEPDRLVIIADGGTDDAPVDVTYGTFREVMARSRTVQVAAVSRSWQPTLTGVGDAERLDGQSVSADYFRVLGMAPALGRDFAAADDLPGAPPVAIVSDGVWRGRLGADPALVGRAITLDGAAVTIVGIMPAEFENVVSPEARIWRPLGYDPALPIDGREWGHHLQLLARLERETDRRLAQDELAGIARSPAAPFSRPAWADLRGGLVVTPLQDHVTSGSRPALRAVVVATLLLLLIAVVNVTNLMMGRGAERRGELATCAAFGASRLRLLTPMLVEGLLVALAGGVLGVALAYALVTTLVAQEGFAIPRAAAIRVDRVALTFAAALTALVGIVAGCIPGLLHSSHQGVPASGPRIHGTHHRMRRGFVAAEVALALVLLVAAGLLVRTVQRMMAVSPGFRADGVLTLQVQVSGNGSSDANSIRQYFARVRDAVASVPEAVSAGLTSQLPFTGDADVWGVATRDDSHLPRGADRSALRHAISPGYLETMGVPLVSGRTFDERDRAGGRPVAVVSASLARRRLPGRNPLGEQIRIGGADNTWFTVVGVVGDTRHASLTVPSADAVYVPAPQWLFADRAMWVAVRTDGDAAALAPAVRRAIRGVGGDQPVIRVATMERRVLASTGRQRFVSTAFYAFAVVALLLAGIGVYGVLAAGVVERTRELAVRAAVGASRARLIGMIMSQAGTVAALGMMIGGGVAIAVTRTLTTLLFEVSPLDAATYASVVLLMTLVTALGALVPAWRAGRIAPAIALKGN